MAKRNNVLTSQKVTITPVAAAAAAAAVPTLNITSPDDSLPPQPAAGLIAQGTVNPTAGTMLAGWLVDGQGNRTYATNNGPAASPRTRTFPAMHPGYSLLTI